MNKKGFTLRPRAYSLQQTGFTLIELLVVVAIIGVLAVIIISSLSKARQKAKVANLVSQLQQVEKALIYTYFDENRSEWWTEAEIDAPGNNPTIEYIISIPEGDPMGTFSTWFKNSPGNYFTDGQYQFDNDGDTHPGCGGSGPVWRGVNLFLQSVPREDAHAVDEYFDGGIDGTCGKIRHSNKPNNTSELTYSISLDQES